MAGVERGGGKREKGEGIWEGRKALHFCACQAGYIWPPHLSCLMIQTLSGACNRLLVFIYYSFTLLHNDNGYFRHAVLICHRVALTNASAWSLNKFYIIQCNVALRIISTSTLKYKLQQNTSKWKVYSKRVVIKEAWENSRHFAKLPLVSPRNDVWETNAEIPYWWRVTIQI